MKKLIFDFDGTLVDSMGVWCGTMFRILDEHGVAYGDDLVKIITPLGSEGTAKYFIEQLGLDSTVEALTAMMRSYCFEGYRDRVMAKETVADTLRLLKEKGYSLNVLTASPHSSLDVCLQHNGIYDLFDNVWSCDDFHTTKTNPDIYKMAAEKLGMAVDNCIFLDDNIHADLTAKEAGMTVIGAYDKTSDGFVDKMKETCDGYIYQFSELPALLERLN